jgi:hypothetical protein
MASTVTRLARRAELGTRIERSATTDRRLISGLAILTETEVYPVHVTSSAPQGLRPSGLSEDAPLLATISLLLYD